MDRQLYRFGGFQVDTQSRLLIRDGERVQIPPKSADLLIALLDRNGELVAKEELIDALWPNTFVEENNLAKHVFLLRKTLGENEGGAAYIETVPKRGYRFVGHVERTPLSSGTLYETHHHAREQILIEETHSSTMPKAAWAVACAILLAISVLAAIFLRPTVNGYRWRSVLIQPFAPSRDTDPSLASAFTQEVATRLRTVPGLQVVSLLSPLDAKAAGPGPPVETILSGRLDLSGGGARVAAQLIKANDGAVIWAEEATDLEVADLHPALARLASSIAARLYGRLAPLERARLERRGSTNAEAYRAFLLGRAEMLNNPLDTETAPEKAAAYLETAIRLDPGFAEAWAALALARTIQHTAGNSGPSPLSTAMQNADRALAIDPANIMARHALIRIFQWNGQHDHMLREAKRVLEINAADPEAQTAAAFAYRYSAMLDRAIDLYERYLTAYPDDQDAWYQLVHACLFAKAYDRGIRHAQRQLSAQRLLFPTFLLYFNAGDLPKALTLARQSIASNQGGAPEAYFAPLVVDSAGLHAEARAAWERAAERLEGRLGRAENERTRIFLAMTYARLGRQDAAREQIRRAIAVNAGDPSTLFFVSETYALLGDRAPAVDALRRSVAGGFLGLHFLDYYQQPPNGWSRFRQDPEFVSIHAGLAARIADLRTRY
jgi:DNA-binding winged helix-turn-helix (wHTH) protein/tetratricopeptide (TPR) repeat protein